MSTLNLIHGSSADQTADAVGSDFSRTPNAFLELFNAYYNSLILLKDNNLHSISFPLISSGIFGGNLPDPPGESAKQCGRAYNKFVQNYPDYNIDVMLCAFNSIEYQSAQTELSGIGLV